MAKKIKFLYILLYILLYYVYFIINYDPSFFFYAILSTIITNKNLFPLCIIQFCEMKYEKYKLSMISLCI